MEQLKDRQIDVINYQKNVARRTKEITEIVEAIHSKVDNHSGYPGLIAQLDWLEIHTKQLRSMIDYAHTSPSGAIKWFDDNVINKKVA